MNKLILILSFALCFSSSLSAHDHDPLFNQVNLQAQADMEIPNDEIQIVMAVEKEDVDSAKLAREINEVMQWALGRIKASDEMQVRTLSYNTNPVYEKKTVIAWRGSQQLELKGSAIAEITSMAGKLQEKLQIKSMHFKPSRDTRKEYENKLIEQAMVAFKERVQLIKKHMEGKNVRIINININTNAGYPRPVYAESRMMAMQADTAPSVEAGTSNITVTVSGSVQYF